MRRLIFVLLFGVFFVGFVGAECELATPRYGVVQCVNTQQTETLYKNFECGDEFCSTAIPCLSNCQATFTESSLFGDGSCPFGYFRKYEVKLNDDSFEEPPSISWNRGDSFIIKAYCRMPALGYTKPINDYYPNSKITYLQDRIMLYEGWAGSLPNTPISGSGGCILNKDIKEEPNIDFYLDPNTGIKESKEASSFPSFGSWEINDYYIFVKDWQTGIAGISLTYDKENNAYWCGGQYGSRKIYSVKEVNSNSGQCYAIPQSVELSGVECCFPSDCNDKFGAEYTCNPENWECEQTKPCNSQMDCESTFGEGVCQNGQINKWVCDLNKKWGSYVGTCVHSSKAVSECPSDCSSKEYYNEEQGACLSRAGLSSIEKFNSSFGIGEGNFSSTGTTILIVFLVLIGSSIAFFFYVKNKKKPVAKKDKPKKEKERPVEKQMSGSKHCTACGYLLRKGSKFCTICGKKTK